MLEERKQDIETVTGFKKGTLCEPNENTITNNKTSLVKTVEGNSKGTQVIGNHVAQMSRYLGSHLFEDQLLDMPKPNGFKPEDLCNKLVKEFNEKPGGSTLTVTTLSKEGELEIATLGDSPVYLVVKDNNTRKDVVIQLTEDMDAESKRYTGLASILGGRINGKRLNGYLATFGAIGDKAVDKGLIQKPEKYNFGSRVHHDKLNAFLQNTLGIQNANINKMLKSDEAKVVTFSDGLAQSKIYLNGKNASVAHYKIKLNDLVEDYETNPNTLPESKEIEFEKVPSQQKEQGRDVDVEILQDQQNPIILISQNKLPEAKKVIEDLRSPDDIVGGMLKPGRVKVVLDGHENPVSFQEEPVSHQAAKSAEKYINECLEKEKINPRSTATAETHTVAASTSKEHITANLQSNTTYNKSEIYQGNGTQVQLYDLSTNNTTTSAKGDTVHYTNYALSSTKESDLSDKEIKDAMKKSLQKASTKSDFPLKDVEKLIRFAQKYGGVGNAKSKDSKENNLTALELFSKEWDFKSSKEGKKLFKKAAIFSSTYQKEMLERKIFTGEVLNLRVDKNITDIGARLTRIPPEMIEEIIPPIATSKTSDINTATTKEVIAAPKINFF